MLPSSVCPDLSSEDKEVKRQLTKCLPWVYSELIRSDIPEPSSVNPSRPPVSRPSLPFVMKPSREGPSVLKPSREELQARVESLVKKKRSVKRKAQAPPKSSLVVRGKILRLGASSPSSTAKEWGSSNQVPKRGQAPPPSAKVSRAAGPRNPSGRSAEPPLEVLPIFVWSPLAQNIQFLPTMPEDEERDRFGTEGDEDSLLTNSELAAGAVSSILRDSDLKKVDAMSVEEALALSLRGAATVCSDVFICLFHRCFKLFITFISFLQVATYVKSLAKRSCLSEGYVRAMEAYKAEVASLTSERADLRAQVRCLTEDVVNHKSDLKHTLTAKSRAEEQEKKVWDKLRAVNGDLRMVREEL